MYITPPKIWYSKDEEQRSGPYLMLFQQQWNVVCQAMPRELRCLVRNVRLYQLGNFMMGKCNLKLPGEDKPITLSLSGMFGSDGLPLEVPKPEDIGRLPSRLWPLLHPLPEDLMEHFWRADADHAGNSEAARDIRIWAVEHEATLRKFRKDRTPVGQLPTVQN